MHVRKAAPEDAQVIQAIAWATWPKAYGSIITKEQIAYMLDRMYALDVLRAEMKGEHVFLIAEHDGVAVGFAGMEHGFHGSNSTRLHKLYVLPAFQGTGVGGLLIQHCRSAAIEYGDATIELNVNRQNPAVETYRKWGFSIADSVVLDIGNGFVMDDHVMVFALETTEQGTA